MIFVPFNQINKHKAKYVTTARIQKQKSISDNDIDVNKILISKKEPYETKNALKYFIGYNNIDAIRPLWVVLPQMTGFAN